MKKLLQQLVEQLRFLSQEMQKIQTLMSNKDYRETHPELTSGPQEDSRIKLYFSIAEFLRARPEDLIILSINSGTNDTPIILSGKILKDAEKATGSQIETIVVKARILEHYL
ncbi:MAG: hypothetical protein PHT40_01105 [Patescibacteria group bacterium]|nr:hypothetical protein [Patescibacteria group bacterium]